MSAKNAGASSGASIADRELVFTRIFDAPRELVFDVWTDPQHLAQWWGPQGFTTTIHEMDVRPGGLWRLTMHGPDGRDYRNRIVMLEVVKPERLFQLNAIEICRFETGTFVKLFSTKSK